MPTEDEIRAGNLNVIGSMWHAIKCAFIADRNKPCDCSPLDTSKAMTSADVLSIFRPLPPEEAAALRDYMD